MRELAIFFTAIVMVTGSASAVVIRHDRPDADYRTASERFPALLSLYRTGAGYRDCIATLIAPSWAVTAAHCTEDDSLVSQLDGDGYPIEFESGRTVRVDKVVRPALREGEERAPDIALIHLTEPVTDIDPVPVYEATDELSRTVMIPGWGGTGDGLNGLGETDGLFRIAENRVAATTETYLVFRFDDPRSRTGSALAYEGISGPGDSGGPALMMTPRGLAIAGIGSAQRTFGRPEGVYNADEYYIRVSSFLGWIAATMEESGN